MVYRVLLVGCGNVGSRHLQALVKIPFPLKIDIIEPNPSSKKLGLSRLEEISYNDCGRLFKNTSRNSTSICEFAIASLARMAYGQRLNEYKIGNFIFPRFRYLPTTYFLKQNSGFS